MPAQVVHQQNLVQVSSGGSVQDAVHRAQQRGPGFVVEADNDAGRRQRLAVLFLEAPVKQQHEQRYAFSRSSRVQSSLVSRALWPLTRDGASPAAGDAETSPR